MVDLSFPSKYPEMPRFNIQERYSSLGRAFAVGAIGPFHFTGWVAWLTWIMVHIFYLIGFRNRLLVLIQDAWAYFTFQPGACIIIPADDAQEEEGKLSQAKPDNAKMLAWYSILSGGPASLRSLFCLAGFDN